MLTLQTSEAEIATLKYEMFHYPDAIVQKRVLSIYIKAIDPKLSCEKVGIYCGLKRNSVSQNIKIYNQLGIDGLKFNNYGTNKSALAACKISIISDLESNPVHQLSQAKERIEQLTGIKRSNSAISTFLKKHGFKCQKLGHVPSKADDQKQEQYLKETLNSAIIDAKDGKKYLLFMDAAHFVMGCFLCNVWSRVRLFIKSPAGRKRLNVIGAIDAINKQVYFQSNTTYVNAETVAEFLAYLRKMMPLLPIQIVLDNARYQHCKYIKKLADELDITLLFLPSVGRHHIPLILI